jgi:hypothetical protein
LLDDIVQSLKIAFLILARKNEPVPVLLGQKGDDGRNRNFTANAEEAKFAQRRGSR